MSRIILRRFQKTPLQITGTMHDPLNAHGTPRGAIENKMVGKASADGQGANALKLGRAKSSGLANFRKLRQQSGPGIEGLQKSLGHIDRGVVQIPPILVREVGFRAAREGDGVLHFVARAFLRIRSSVALV